MGCAFNCVVVPKAVKTKAGVQEWYAEYRSNLLKKYGYESDKEFPGYSGDLASDDGKLVFAKDKVEYDGDELEDDLDDLMDTLMATFEPHVKKWGPSVAIRVGKWWVIGGGYSD